MRTSRKSGRRPWAVAVHAALATAMLVARGYATSIDVHGLLEVTAAQRGSAYDLNLLTRGDSPFDAYGARLFADARVNEGLQVSTQLVLHDASGPYIDGAYATWTPWVGRDLHVQAGKIPWPIGTYAPRTYSNRNPLIGTPLMYQYHSTLVWYDLPHTADALLGTSGSGQVATSYDGYPMGRGMPVVDDSYWDVGVVVLGSKAPFEVALGGVAGAPGWGSTGEDDNSGKSMLGRIGLAPWPGLRFGVSGSFGPYLNQSAIRADLPPGTATNAFKQRLGMADLEVLLGHLELRGEAARNRWDSPWVGPLTATSAYGELKLTASFGGYVAGRYDVLRFGKIVDSSGRHRPWDSNVTRIEGGVGYRITRDLSAKAVVQHDELDRPDTTPEFHRPTLVAGQMVVSF